MITQLDSHKFATHHEMKKITQKSLVKTFHCNLFAMAIIAYLIRDQYFHTIKDVMGLIKIGQIK